ncbi:carbohydrate porin [Alicyclobacillus shizuokensis]|uniref:carbohydrate porin n=1 Tax=Alicyclobacillus shizuokensis TaxID=392014 RepID=UPI001FE1E837|nr:carbohydrate porin [Alicyclobacillus shizuokensis]
MNYRMWHRDEQRLPGLDVLGTAQVIHLYYHLHPMPHITLQSLPLDDGPHGVPRPNLVFGRPFRLTMAWKKHSNPHEASKQTQDNRQ